MCFLKCLVDIFLFYRELNDIYYNMPTTLIVLKQLNNVQLKCYLGSMKNIEILPLYFYGSKILVR